MKNLSILVLLFMPFMFIRAQISINIEKPFSNLLLHIDPKKNTTQIITSQDDDIVITQDGKMGIGITTPDSDLTIKGSIKIDNRTQANGKNLAAKSDGTAFGWQIHFLYISKKRH